MSKNRHASLSFILVALLFLLWGIANNMTDTLLAAFKRIMSMSDAQTSLIQFAFYGSYFCFALPAALFLRRYSYKKGIVLGLALYATGTLLFLPASRVASYTFFLVAIYIMAGGCSVLETAANPYILTMGDERTAIRRLNIAQSLNPLGSIIGIILSQNFILSALSSADAAERSAMSGTTLANLQARELGAITSTYLILGLVLVVVMIAIICTKMHEAKEDSRTSIVDSFARLFSNKIYRRGVVAQFFYVGAQIGVWSFTIRVVMHELGVLEKQAATIYLLSIIAFGAARFFFTWLMKYFTPVNLLMLSSFAATICTSVVVLGAGSGHLLAVALILISAFMSLMFPTIYGLALEGVRKDAKIGASGLIMAILGGAILTPLQGKISDLFGIYTSFAVPLCCFIAVLIFAISVKKINYR